ncbi:MAG TPA: hypothetical protein VMH85_10130 [Terriglobales bacterium]|nr:hypothetical protein [Terriglobales bacterium]
MKRNWLFLVLVPGVLLVCLFASAKQDSKQGYQTAKVVSVEKHETSSNNVGGNPSDAPLQAEDYSYDIGIRLECDVYVGRYQSAIDYLPSVFAPNHEVDVRLQKHILYVSLPYGDREVKMGIVSHRRLKEKDCPVSS